MFGIGFHPGGPQTSARGVTEIGDGRVQCHSLQTLDFHPSGTARGAAASKRQLLDRSNRFWTFAGGGVDGI